MGGIYMYIMHPDVMEVVVETMYVLDSIKSAAIKVNAYSQYFKEVSGEERVPLFMPAIDKFLQEHEKPRTIWELLEMIKEYYALIPNKEELEEMEYEVAKSILHGNAFYNEIDLYEANVFLGIFDEMIAENRGKKYVVDLYDLNGYSLYFDDKENAERFISEYGSPCTLFLLENNQAIEIGCY